MDDELDIDGSVLDTIEKDLADVELALAQLDEGTYGRCSAQNRAVGRCASTASSTGPSQASQRP